jgi:polyisoprenoid-binding protein YceI
MIRIPIAVAALAALAGTAAAQEKTKYYVGHHEKFVNITFQSDMEIETIVGTTMKATGEIEVDAAGTGSVSLRVPVAGLTTGIKMRDEHMLSEMWLDAKKHDSITFVSKKVEKVKDAAGKVSVTGDLTVHGVARELTLVVEYREISEEAARKAKFPDGKWLKFSGEFKVKLSDHGVMIPDVAAAKVNDEWTVKLALYASTAKLPENK